MLKKIFNFILSTFLWVLYSLILLWCGGVIYFNLGWGLIATLSFVILMLVAGYFRKNILGFYWWTSAIVLFFIGYFSSIIANDEHTWQTPWSQSPIIERNGAKIIIKNIRDFSYKTPENYQVSYVNEEYDPNELVSLDFAVSHWNGIQAIAHTMLSFGFKDGRYLALSMETRLPQGINQGGLPGLFKQYNLICLLAKEEDIFALRSNHRKEKLRLFRLNLTPQQIRTIFMDFVQKINVLQRTPEFYNTLTANCTTEILPPLRECLNMGVDKWSPVLDGMSNQKAFDQGLLLHQDKETLNDLRERALIPEGIKERGKVSFSKLIREKVGITESREQIDKEPIP
ncbi:MAG: DUF4105 domain-containing protein [Akkermansia sp.]